MGGSTPGCRCSPGCTCSRRPSRSAPRWTQAGALLARGKLVHPYPHSWRSRAPLIFRATPQWFIRLDGPEAIRQRALDAIDRTVFVPEKGRTRLASMVANRPDWCVSRQRAWGVPIAVFVERATGEVLRDPAVMARIVEAFREEGADAWYASPPSRFLGEGRDPDAYEQVRDIVDVWFESGSTHGFALQARGLPWPADLYLEGSDQHRGWFQSSLLEAVGTRGAAPFKAVLTHGFTLDEQGRKMSKSAGNGVEPQKVLDQYGADILRLWVMNTDITEDQRIGPEVLKQTAELYRRLRNTLRWLLGSLSGFTPAEAVSLAEMPELERWVLHRLSALDALLRRAVETHDWAGVYPAIHAFCSADLSAFYFDVRKDALYCDRFDSPTRRAARTVLDHLHRCLTTWLAPVLAFTAEEAWVARFGDTASVHLTEFPELPAAWQDEALALRWEAIRRMRGKIDHRRRLRRGARTHQVLAGGGGARSAWRATTNLAARGSGPNLHCFQSAVCGRRACTLDTGSSAGRAANARAAGRCWRKSARCAPIPRCACAAPTRSSPVWWRARHDRAAGAPSPRPSPKGRGRVRAPSPSGRGLG